jgi:hypothetical protein
LCSAPVYRSIDELQTDLDLWVRDFNEQRPHQGRWCFGKGENDRSLITSDKQNPTAQPGTDCQIEFRLIQMNAYAVPAVPIASDAMGGLEQSY